MPLCSSLWFAHKMWGWGLQKQNLRDWWKKVILQVVQEKLKWPCLKTRWCWGCEVLLAKAREGKLQHNFCEEVRRQMNFSMGKLGGVWLPESQDALGRGQWQQELFFAVSPEGNTRSLWENKNRFGVSTQSRKHPHCPLGHFCGSPEITRLPLGTIKDVKGFVAQDTKKLQVESSAGWHGVTSVHHSYLADF